MDALLRGIILLNKYDWSIPHKKGYDVYELLLAGAEQVQGMIAFKHIRNQYYTHVDIVEAAPWNECRTA